MQALFDASAPIISERAVPAYWLVWILLCGSKNLNTYLILQVRLKVFAKKRSRIEGTKKENETGKKKYRKGVAGREYYKNLKWRKEYRGRPARCEKPKKHASQKMEKNIFGKGFFPKSSNRGAADVFRNRKRLKKQFCGRKLYVQIFVHKFCFCKGALLFFSKVHTGENFLYMHKTR